MPTGCSTAGLTPNGFSNAATMASARPLAQADIIHTAAAGVAELYSSPTRSRRRKVPLGRPGGACARDRALPASGWDQSTKLAFPPPRPSLEVVLKRKPLRSRTRWGAAWGSTGRNALPHGGRSSSGVRLQITMRRAARARADQRQSAWLKARARLAWTCAA